MTELKYGTFVKFKQVELLQWCLNEGAFPYTICNKVLEFMTDKGNTMTSELFLPLKQVQPFLKRYLLLSVSHLPVTSVLPEGLFEGWKYFHVHY